MSITLFKMEARVLFYLLVATAVSGHIVHQNKAGLFEGDIAVSEFPPSFLSTKSGIRDDRFRWPNATMPYSFEPGYPSYLKELFERAAAHISEHTCIKFQPRTTEPDFVYVTAQDGCWSFVGRLGDGSQEMSLPAPCGKFGIFVHEIVHALGFFHEQSRTDRDSYVKIIWENIPPEQQHNFLKYSEEQVSSFCVGYDYGSIMHYPRNAFSLNGSDTILPNDPDVNLGQLEKMSDGDIKKLQNMYCAGENGNPCAM